MKLSQYDGKLVRISTFTGEVMEGYCEHNTREFNEAIWGRDEECLQIYSVLIFKNEIEKVEVIDDFSAPYGDLERIVAEGGADLIFDSLEREDDIHSGRLLDYLYDHPEEIKDSRKDLEYYISIKEGELKEKALRILEKY